MNGELSRRGALTLAAGATMAAASNASARARPEIVLLSSRSGVYTPARGDPVMQFSFDFPEPSIRMGDFLFAFRVNTFENAYALDPEHMRVARSAYSVRLVCDGLLGAGGQIKALGELSADFELASDGVLSWRARTRMDRPVKSISSVVRGLPRGEVSVSCNAFQNFGDDEKVFEYPHLFGAMTTPLMLLKSADQRLFELSARQTEVRPARFFLQPGPDGYRVELIHENIGWAPADDVTTAQWRVGPARSYADAAGAHFAHVETTYAIPRFEARPDAPEWMRDICLVLSIHGMHWTGYIFNDYARMREILRWASRQIEPRRVLVFLPGWDGRYYWNYPLYLPDPRMGGATGFAALTSEARRAGFRVAPMFGANAANRTWPEFAQFADAVTQRVDGDSWDLNWVDWDSDRRNEGFTPFMNLGIPSWRAWLIARISAVISQFGADAYFLDIAGAWENNRKADMNAGTQLLVEELHRLHPRVAPIGEMLFDAQMAYFPMSQVIRYPLYPAGQDAYVRNFQHLSRPAPGRGSSGVHEAGFGAFNPRIEPGQRAIPTISIVDDTFAHERAAMAAYIAEAKAWDAARTWRGYDRGD
jgi:hypothetical protein